MSGLRRTRMVRRTELTRGGKLYRRAAMKTAPKPAKRPRDTGPSEPTKALLWTRAGGCCEICGQTLSWTAPFSRHHRRPRGSGGSSVAWINDVSNLLLLCGSATSPAGCHQLVESQRQLAYANGWAISLHAITHPATIPALLARSTTPTHLHPDGTYSEEHP